LEHCSKLQAWYEHHYDTRLLQINLAFPLLKKLTEVGDPLAQRVFKEEIAKRIESGHLPTFIYLSNEGYFDYLTKEELRTILHDPKSNSKRIKKDAINALNAIRAKEFKHYGIHHKIVNNAYLLLHFFDLDEFLTYLKELLKVKNISEWTDINNFFTHYLWVYVDAYLEKMSEDRIYEDDNYNTYKYHIEEGELDEILTIDLGQVGEVLRMIRTMDHEDFAQNLVESFYDSKKYYKLLFLEFLGERDLIKSLLKNSFYTITNSGIDNMPGITFIDAYLGIEIVKEEIYKSLKSGDPYEIAEIFRGNLVDYLKQEELRLLIESSFPVILKSLEKLPSHNNIDIFYGLIDMCEDIELLERFISVFLEKIQIYTYIVLSELIDSIRKLELLNKFSSQLKAHFLTISQSMSYFDYDCFIALVKVAKEMGWLEEYFLTLFEIIDKLQDRDKSKALSTLLIIAKKMGRLEETFPIFLEMIDKLSEKEYDMFFGLLKLAKREGWIEKCFPVFLKSVYGLTKYRSRALSDLLEITIEKRWVKQFFPVFLENLDKLPNYRKYLAFFDLIKSLKNTELFNDYYSRIKNLSLSLLDGLGELPEYRRQDAYSNLNWAIKGTDLENEPAFKEWKEKNST